MRERGILAMVAARLGRTGLTYISFAFNALVVATAVPLITSLAARGAEQDPAGRPGDRAQSIRTRERFFIR